MNNIQCTFDNAIHCSSNAGVFHSRYMQKKKKIIISTLTSELIEFYKTSILYIINIEHIFKAFYLFKKKIMF